MTYGTATRMKSFVLFLKGAYRREDLPFYQRLGRAGKTVAVDGGYSFFRKTASFPDLLIGDFDSLKPFPRDLPMKTKIVRFPVKKDKTDLHLAIDYCLEKGARAIDIVQPTVGEIDHFLANAHSAFYGLSRTGGSARRVRIISPTYEIRPVVDETVIFTDKIGDTISVLPLSDDVSLTVTGAEYCGRGIRLRMGETRGMRNRIMARRARFEISGKALVIRNFTRRYGL